MVDRPVIVRGILVPADWNDKGEVVGIAMATYEEKEYVIEGCIRDLVRHMRKEAEVKGLVKKRHGEDILVVTDYRIIEESPTE